MDEKILQDNLRRMMKEQKFSMLRLSIEAQLNETAIRDILNGKVKNPTYQTLYKIAKILKCSVDDLVIEASDKKRQKLAMSLLFNNSKINVRRFAKVIAIIDASIKEQKMKLTSYELAKTYFAAYDLSIMQNDLADKQFLSNEHLAYILAKAKRS